MCHHGVNTHLVHHKGQLQKAGVVEEEKKRAEEARSLLAPRRRSRAPSRQRSESESSNSNMDTFAEQNGVNVVDEEGNVVSEFLNISSLVFISCSGLIFTLDKFTNLSVVVARGFFLMV